ncbi:hypothetical protein CBR_g60775 [Chara braunii]|uniref:Leucine-rich repeat-containing N-terminal plant-type domain-containing protein n=1 Tax=Chara braunii TaxID=69332 RepID=A0A388MF72_CHABU|nr:hypothetical protein CBR_g60775 [Chara braunii]|eukprot:GBG93216.1 hypothetical protein CBR_g60775 [Chara braunii]
MLIFVRPSVLCRGGARLVDGHARAHAFLDVILISVSGEACVGSWRLLSSVVDVGGTEVNERLESSPLGSLVSVKRHKSMISIFISSNSLPAYAKAPHTLAGRRAASRQPGSGMMELIGAPLVVSLFTLLLMSRCSAQNPEMVTLRAAMKSWTNGAAVLGSSWNAGDNPCVGWTGVECNENNKVDTL